MTAAPRQRLDIAEPGGFWFFAYGSLMWDPPFRPAEARAARIFGWHRAFCVSSETYRGTPERPGLTLGLRHGGSCAGLALRIAAADRGAAIRAIEAREMDDDPIYLCRRLTLHMEDRQAPGYTLVTNRGDRTFAGGLTFEETAGRIAASAGERGANIAYLAETVSRLEAAGIAPRRLRVLLGRARQLAVAGHNAD